MLIMNKIDSDLGNTFKKKMSNFEFFYALN